MRNNVVASLMEGEASRAACAAVSAGLVLALACPVAAPAAFADEAAALAKDETVYVKADASGATSGVYVVNRFAAGAPQTVEDPARYEQVVNLTTDDDLQERDGVVELTTLADAPFYYQGTMDASTDLPWDIAVSYRLDGEDATADEVAGATGRVEVVLSVTARTDDADVSDFAESCVLQAQGSFDADSFEPVDAGDATLAYAGSSVTAACLVLPGESKTFAIQGDARDFSYDGWQIAAMPLDAAVELSEEDTAGIRESFDELEDATDSLASGAGELSDGAAEVSDGASGLASGSRSAADGAAQVDAAAGSLAAGAADVSSAAETLAAGTSDVAAGADDLSSGAADLAQGASALTGGVGQAVAAAAALSGQSTSLLAGWADVRDGAADLASGAAALQQGSASYRAALQGSYQDASSAQAAYQAALAGYRAAADAARANPTAETAAALAQAGEDLSAASAAYGAAQGANGALDNALAGYAAVDAGVADTASGASALASGASDFDAGLNAYVQGVDSLAAGMPALQDGVADTAAGAQDVSAGASDLQGATADAASGAQAVASGASSVSGGAAQLGSATGELSAGSQDVAAGAATLASGAAGLAGGASDLSDGAADLASAVAGMGDEAIAEMQDSIDEKLGAGYEERSFADPSNENVDTVQFVYVIDGVGDSDTEDGQEGEGTAEGEQPAESGLLDRLLALFSKGDE